MLRGFSIIQALGGTPPILLARSAVLASRASGNVAGDATFQALATINIPAGFVGANDTIRIFSHWSHTNSANTKNLTVRLGGTPIRTTLPTTSASSTEMFIIGARNSVTSQIASTNTGGGNVGGLGTTGIAPTATSINMAAAQTIEIGGNWTAATLSETISVEQYVIEVFRG